MLFAPLTIRSGDFTTFRHQHLTSKILLAHCFDASLRVSITSITLLDSFWSKNKVKTRNIDKVVLITVFRGQDQELVVHTTTLRDTAHFYFVRTQIICQTFQVPLTLFFPITHEPYYPSFSYSLFLQCHPISFHFSPTTFHIVVVTNILSFPTTLHIYSHVSLFISFINHMIIINMPLQDTCPHLIASLSYFFLYCFLLLMGEQYSLWFGSSFL